MKFAKLSHYPRRKQKQKAKLEKLTKWVNYLINTFSSSKYSRNSQGNFTRNKEAE